MLIIMPLDYTKLRLGSTQKPSIIGYELDSGGVGSPKKYQSTSRATPTNSGSAGEIWMSAPPSMAPSDEPMNPKKL